MLHVLQCLMSLLRFLKKRNNINKLYISIVVLASMTIQLNRKKSLYYIHSLIVGLQFFC